MAHWCTAVTDLTDSREAGRVLGQQILADLGGQAPEVVILFASTCYDYPLLLNALRDTCRPKVLVGGSSAGEFTNSTQGEGLACATALRVPGMEFHLSLGRDLSSNHLAAARGLASGFRGLRDGSRVYQYALVLTDALAGRVEEFIGELTAATAGTYQFFGGGVGGDDQFSGTRVFCGTEAVPDAAVALEILSTKPLGIGVAHGWTPAGPPMRVTEAQGTRLISLNARPAIELFEAHAQATGQRFDRQDALPFFLHNILGVQSEAGDKLRVPLAVESDGSILCATELPERALVRIMSTTSKSAADAAQQAVSSALTKLAGCRPAAALMFDCVATRLRLGREFAQEVEVVRQALGNAKLAGFNSIGQIARAEGQFSGFHNCTAVICAFPE